METTTTARLRITIEHDSDVAAPWKDCDGEWRVISNDPRDGLYEPKESFYTLGFRRKLDVGLAFPLSKYEHGGVMWSIAGHGTQCRFDTTTNAGFLVWDHTPADMGAKAYAERQADASSFLERFNEWVNGNCYWYRIERVTYCEHCDNEITEELDSCGGFIGGESLFAHLRDEMEMVSEHVEFAGTGAWLGDYHSIR